MTRRTDLHTPDGKYSVIPWTPKTSALVGGMMPTKTPRVDRTLTPDEILANYSPRLISILASLAGAPEPICQATIQLLPFGSRAALEATGVAQTGPEVDEAGHRGLVLTPLAFEVIEAAAAIRDRPTLVADTDVDWDARANRALAGHPDRQK